MRSAVGDGLDRRVPRPAGPARRGGGDRPGVSGASRSQQGGGRWRIFRAACMADGSVHSSSRKPGRAFANLVQRQPLPGGTDSVNFPKILTPTAIAIQTADNTPVVEQDLTDTFVSAPVRTIAGQESVAIQLIDQAPISMDDVIFGDLVAAYAQNVDVQVLVRQRRDRRGVGRQQHAGNFDRADQQHRHQGALLRAGQRDQPGADQHGSWPRPALSPIRGVGLGLATLLDDQSRPLFHPERERAVQRGRCHRRRRTRGCRRPGVGPAVDRRREHQHRARGGRRRGLRFL